MKRLKALVAAFTIIFWNSTYSQVVKDLEARVSTQGGRLNIRRSIQDGSVGGVKSALPNGTRIKIDPAYLARKLRELGRTDPDALKEFLQQNSCTEFNSAWAKLASQKRVEGESYDFVKVYYQDGENLSEGFASIQYLEGINFDCKDLYKEMALALDTTIDCESECIIKKEQSLGMAGAWADILKVMSEDDGNEELGEESQYLKHRLAQLCEDESPSEEPGEIEIAAITPTVVAPAQFKTQTVVELNQDYKLGVLSPVAAEEFKCEHLSDVKKSIPSAPFDLNNLKSQNPGASDMTLLQQWSIDNKVQSFYRFQHNLKLVCENIPENDRTRCLNLLMGSFKQMASCHEGNLPVEGNRAIWTSFMRNPELIEMIYLSFLVESPSAEVLACREEGNILKQKACASALLLPAERSRFLKRSRLWEEFQVMPLAMGLKVPNAPGVTGYLSEEGLDLLIAGYGEMKSTMEKVSQETGKDHSYTWGAGGFFARIGELEVNGQFGAVNSRNPLLMEVVIDPNAGGENNGKVSNPKGRKEIAERIAHENFHSKDFLDGNLSYNTISWGEKYDGNQRARGIFRECGSLSLRNCRQQKPALFSFRPGSTYPATDVYEFYGSMVNIWVRDRMNNNKTTYACATSQTRELWREMETQFLGVSITECDE